MIQRKISNNKELPRLIAVVDARMGPPHGAYAALLYTWCISHLDVDGRLHGDPLIVKGAVVPRLPFITPEHCELYLEAMHQVGLVVRYEAKDDTWLYFPGFKDSQPGLRRDREKASTIPPPPAAAGGPPAELRLLPGNWPGEVEEKGIEDQDQTHTPRARVGDPLSPFVQEQWMKIHRWPPKDSIVGGISQWQELLGAIRQFAELEQLDVEEAARRLLLAFAAYIRSCQHPPGSTPEAFVRNLTHVLRIARQPPGEGGSGGGEGRGQMAVARVDYSKGGKGGGP